MPKYYEWAALIVLTIQLALNTLVGMLYRSYSLLLLCALGLILLI